LTFLLHNHRILSEQEFVLGHHNRLFQYNDGVFETLVLARGGIRYLEDHLLRLRKALRVLKMEEPELVQDVPRLTEQVRELAALNGLGTSARVKFKVWRAGKGLFTPERMDSEILVTVQPSVVHPAVIRKAGICEGIRNRFTPFSFFKGPYSLHYVMAALERKERNLNEIILLDEQGQVSEAGTSNVFWVRDGSLFTPSLETGCIDGVMRVQVEQVCAEEQVPLEIGLFRPKEMLGAEAVFTSNVTGLYPIEELEGQKFVADHPVVERLRARLIK
jgi:branched-subunit amino acid aminotransferase/4-amino-4-deoxychorismate lyase